VEICWNLLSDAIPSADNKERLQAFMRTLVGGFYVGGMESLRRDFLSYCLEKTSSQFCSNIGLEDIKKEDTSLIDGNWVHFDKEASMKMQGIRFFITKYDHFGLGPSLLQDGDFCCVVLGCKMPLVIRPTSTSGHFKVLGPCYIDDVINGELIDAYVKSATGLGEITLV